MKELPAQYDHAAAQRRWYPYWEQQGYFHAEADDRRPAFSIVIPPPNVTGALHLGHALNNTLQDILVRMKRMQGFNVLWMPGTDHAGIATQAVVERRLLEDEGLTRHDLGREGLVERIWKWKDQYERRILGQLKQLGCSCDWQRTRFTLDDQCARAVRETFFKLFADGKIYRGKRLVNWDTFLQTAVSDDEVFHEPVKGHFWHFKYPVVDPQPGEPEYVTIATTRPETMLGDTAVAVHPDPGKAFDKLEVELREKFLQATAKEKGELEEQMSLLLERRGKMLPALEQLRDMARRGVMLELPLTNRQIPLIADEWADPMLGSGCVKITPAHDANDYDVWQRHPEIGAINILNPDGTLGDSVPEKYRGLSVKKSRAAVVDDIEAAGLLDQIEDREIDLAHSDRSKTPIEPYLADQWFVKMGEEIPLPNREGLGEGFPGLAQTAMDAVTDGRVKIIPDRYAKGYLDWLSEKRDWPIGRQLWWGHRIPIWHMDVPSHFQDPDLLSADDLAETLAREVEVAEVDLKTALGWKGLTAIDDYSIRKVLGDLNVDSRLLICVRNEKIDDAMTAVNDELLRFKSTGRRSPPYDNLDIKGVAKYTNVSPDRICKLSREEDVLDTWFSSALWPYSTLGWPDETAELKKFYPTSVLITSRDIITLWVARMVLTGLYNMGDVPFHQVYVHPKILDGYGETMSKSKGNGIDPLDVIEKFGVDALRFGLAYLTTESQDVRMPVEFECPHCGATFPQTKKNRQLPRIDCEKCGQPFRTQWAESDADKALPRGLVVSERFELGRNFCNKLWNASRFVLMNLGAGGRGQDAGGRDQHPAPSPLPPASLLLEDRWLLSRLATVTGEVTAALESYRYADAARTLYGFAWDEFCSFYVEMTKARFAVPEQRAVAQQVIAHSLDTLLRLLHPLTPFVTEEVWQLLGEAAPVRGIAKPPLGPELGAEGQAAAESVCVAPWPTVDTARIDATIEQQFAQFQAVLGAVREVRQTQNIPPKEPVRFTVRCDAATAQLLEPMKPYFESMARATATAFGPAAASPERSASKSLTGMEVHVDISAFFDVEAEEARLDKEQVQLAKFVKSLENKLANANFVNRAPAEVVQAERDKLAEVQAKLAAVETALQKLA